MHVLYTLQVYTEQVASILSMHFMDALQSSLTSSMYHFSQDHSIVASIIMPLQMLSLLLWEKNQEALMRSHILQCLENQNMTLFPVMSLRARRNKGNVIRAVAIQVHGANYSYIAS